MAKDTFDYLVANADGTTTVTLARGYTRDGAQVKAITLREPTVGDQIVATSSGKNEAEREVALFANLAACTPEEIRGLTMKDYRRLQVAYTGFLD